MLNISTAEARSHLSKYISMVELQHENIVIEKRGRKVALIIPFPDTGIETSHHAMPSLAALDALPSRSDTFIGIIKEADLDYRHNRADYLLAKYK